MTVSRLQRVYPNNGGHALRRRPFLSDVWSWADFRGLSSGAQSTYFAIHSMCRLEDPQAWPAVKTLSDMRDVSERTIQREVRELQLAGLVDVSDRSSLRGQGSNLYRLCLPVSERLDGQTDWTTDLPQELDPAPTPTNAPPVEPYEAWDPSREAQGAASGGCHPCHPPPDTGVTQNPKAEPCPPPTPPTPPVPGGAIPKDIQAIIEADPHLIEWVKDCNAQTPQEFIDESGEQGWATAVRDARVQAVGRRFGGIRRVRAYRKVIRWLKSQSYDGPTTGNMGGAW